MRLFDWLNERRVRKHQLEMRRLAVKGMITANLMRILFPVFEQHIVLRQLKKRK